MSRSTLHDRAERSLQLLLGMRLPRVQAALTPFGFNRQVMVQGWDLMRALTLASDEKPLESQSPVSAPSSHQKHIELAAKRWFTVARAVLQHSHPEQFKLLFRGVATRRERFSAIFLEMVFQRLATMASGAAPFGAEGPLVRQLLIEHGLTQEVERQVLDQIQGIWRVRSSDPLTRSTEDDELASSALWAWYLKWSAIAREAIQNKTLRRALGFDGAPAASPRKRSIEQIEVILKGESILENIQQRLLPAADQDHVR